MLEVIKCGKTDYGYWAYGYLKYNGIEVKDIFTINKEVKEKEKYKVLHIYLKRNKKNDLRFKLDL